MYEVALINFTGPVDLLYQLVQKSELEITEIALASVTGQYLGYVGKLSSASPEELNGFIDLAAKLIHIKSLALLPSLEDQAEDETMADLKSQLDEYGRVQQAASKLEEMWQVSPRAWPSNLKPSLELPEQMPPNLNLDQLGQLFEQAIANLPPEPTDLALPPTLTLEEAGDRLLTETGHRLSLTGYLQTLANRLEVIMTFLALLELIKTGRVSVRQEALFGDMIISNEEP